VANFTPRPLYPQGKSPWYQLDRRLVGPQSRSGRRGEEKNTQPLSGIEPPTIQSVDQRCYYPPCLFSCHNLCPFRSHWTCPCSVGGLHCHLLTSVVCRGFHIKLRGKVMARLIISVITSDKVDLFLYLLTHG
jgi:hypothetical protein